MLGIGGRSAAVPASGLTLPACHMEILCLKEDSPCACGCTRRLTWKRALPSEPAIPRKRALVEEHFQTL